MQSGCDKKSDCRNHLKNEGLPKATSSQGRKLPGSVPVQVTYCRLAFFLAKCRGIFAAAFRRAQRSK